MQSPPIHMMCTRCYRVSVPDTRIPGSDLLELLAWCGLGVPGLLYCAWRHLQRAKVCAHCGSPELVREARASRRLARGAAVAGPAAVHSSRPALWPPALRAPRDRLRWGWSLALVALGVLLASGVEWLPGVPAAPPLAQASLWIGASVLGVQMTVGRDAISPWGAWDAQGHPLPVEFLSR